MNKTKSKVVDKFRCIKCEELSIVRKLSSGRYRYSIKCTKCGHGGLLHNDYLIMPKNTTVIYQWNL